MWDIVFAKYLCCFYRVFIQRQRLGSIFILSMCSTQHRGVCRFQFTYIGVCMITVVYVLFSTWAHNFGMSLVISKLKAML